MAIVGNTYLEAHTSAIRFVPQEAMREVMSLVQENCCEVRFDRAR
jgi:hypothetical protein